MTYNDIAAAALARYPQLDPARVDRALAILDAKTIMLARYDEDGLAINPPTKAAYCVKSPKTAGREEIWYIVRPEKKTCQCYDSAAGNICKHRIAVYLYSELPIQSAVAPAEKIKESLTLLGY